MLVRLSAAADHVELIVYICHLLGDAAGLMIVKAECMLEWE